jgi:hypothetical protein
MQPEEASKALDVDKTIREYFKEGYVGVHRFGGVDGKGPAHIVDSEMLFALVEQNRQLLETANTCMCGWCGLVGDKDTVRIMKHAGECTARQDAYELQKRADDAKVFGAVSIALRYGGIDGAHHKQWVIDQMLRSILGEALYVKTMEDHSSDLDYPAWDEGTAP